MLKDFYVITILFSIIQTVVTIITLEIHNI